MVEPYWNEDGDKYAVLVSPDYGAGWSTWNYREMAYDKRVVEFWMAHKGQDPRNSVEAEAYFEELGYHDVYFGGFKSLRMTWVPRGKAWRIDEYDGSEGIIFQGDENWTVIN